MKVWQIALGRGVVALTLGAAGVTYAQVDDLPPPPYGGGYGNHGSCEAEGPMHEGMIEAQGGSIEASNRQGGGTVFSIELPSLD